MNKELVNKIMTKKNIIIASVVLVFIAAIIIVFAVINSNDNASNPNKKEVNKLEKMGLKVKENEVKSLNLVDYENNELTMKIPEGYKVETTGTGMFYVLKVYDPNEERNQIFTILKAQPFLKSNEAKNLWKNYSSLYGANSPYRGFSDAIVMNNPTVEEFFIKFPEYVKYGKSLEPLYATFNFPELNSFKKIEEFPANSPLQAFALDDKILRAIFNTHEGKEGEGFFMASVVDLGNISAFGMDISYYMIYNIMGITSVKDEMINYKDILTKSLNTLEFKESYVQKTIDDGNEETKRALQINAQMQAAYDSYNQAWENRQTSYDISSQKYSDATLGYERVYNPETGDIYKAYNGFTDDFPDSNFEPITDDMYTSPITGYIEK